MGQTEDVCRLRELKQARVWEKKVQLSSSPTTRFYFKISDSAARESRHTQP